MEITFCMFFWGSLCFIPNILTEDGTLTESILKTYVFTKSPQNWFLYLQSFLYDSIQHSLAFQSKWAHYFICLMHDMKKRSSIFSKNRRKLLTSQHQFHPQINHLTGRISPRRTNTTYKENELYILHKHHKKHKPVQFIFHLNNALRLNLSFEHIYFSAYSINRCVFGKLEINSSTHQNLHNFCGIFANVTYYPPGMSSSLSTLSNAFILIGSNSLLYSSVKET